MNIRKTSIFLSLLLFISLNYQAQNVSISGYVFDELTGDRVCNVYVEDSLSKIGVYTDTIGYYYLEFSYAKYVILKAKYRDNIYVSKKLEVINNRKFDIGIKASLILPEVNIQANKKTSLIGVEKIDFQKISNIQVGIGEKDIIKSLQFIPGVSAGNDGNSKINVRGESDNSNMFLLDGVPITNTEHLYGFLSTFNPNIVQSISFYKSGFPSQYSGKTASIIDVQTNKPNLKQTKGSFNIGLLSFACDVGGPIIENKLAYNISLRRSLLDLISLPISAIASNKHEKHNVSYTMYDSNAKLYYILNKKNNIELNAFFSRDNLLIKQDYYFSDGTEYNKNNDIWGDYFISINWFHRFSDKFKSSLKTYNTNSYKSHHSYYGREIKNILEAENTKFSSKNYNIGTELNFNLQANSKNKISFGLNNNIIFYNPYTKNFWNISGDKTNFSSLIQLYKTTNINTNIYIEDDFQLNKHLSILFGINCSSYYDFKDLFVIPEPRFKIVYNINDVHSIIATATKMTQGSHRLFSNDMSINSDIILPCNKQVAPNSSYQASLGYFFAHDNKIESYVDLYYKKLYNLIEYKEGVNYYEGINSWEDIIEAGGIGQVYGMEVFYKQKYRNLNYYLSYTLSFSDRQFANLNFGKPYPFKFDRRHNININGTYNISEKLSCTANWVFYSGSLISLSNIYTD